MIPFEDLTWQSQGTSLQQLLRGVAVLEALRGRRGLSASRAGPHRLDDPLGRSALYQRFLRLRGFLHGASPPQLPPSLADALVP